ncbi:hypothetical protein ABXT21_25210, partial [Ralstonia sp. SM1864_UCD524_TZ4]|uniref:hypothetical protein n=1 Tax=Ralstonia pseudosolanacearum TaxID=1310165 RepID=UPI003391EECD
RFMSQPRLCTRYAQAGMTAVVYKAMTYTVGMIVSGRLCNAQRKHASRRKFNATGGTALGKLPAKRCCA